MCCRRVGGGWGKGPRGGVMRVDGGSGAGRGGGTQR